MRTRIVLTSALLLIVLFVSATCASAKNLLANSGFEVCTTERLPDFWGPGGMGISSTQWLLKTEEWRKRWGVDEKVYHSGKRSLRIDCPGSDSTDLIAYGRWIDLEKLNVPYTLSVWMKSDREDMPVTFCFQFGSKDVKVRKQWARYSVTSSPYDKTQTIIVAPKGKGVLWIDDVQFELGDAPTDYAPSTYDATLTGQAVHRVVPDTRPFRFKPGKTTPALVTIDEHRRLLVDGVPFLPFNVAFGRLPTREVLRDAAEAGFNSVCILVSNDHKVADIRKCLDDANSFGLKVIVSMLGGITTESRTLFITSFRDHPAVLIWYVVDEPDGDHPAVREAYELAKKLDPTHPAYINYAPGFYFPKVLPSDIASLDRYDIGAEPQGPINQAEFVDQLESIAKPAGKPSWITLQSGGYAYWMSRSPTGPEEEAMVYLCLIHGARGIEFWVDKPFSFELWRTMKVLTREIRQLTPVFYSIETPPTVSATPPGIHLVGKTYNGRRYVIAASTLPTPVDAKITVSGGGTSATVLFENRKVKVASGVISDTFAGYQRHVYELR